MFRRLRRFFTKSNIQKQKSYNQKCSRYLSGIDSFNNVHRSNIPSTLTVNNNINIPKKRALVNKKRLSVWLSPVRLGVIKAIANQPAERLMNNPANALSQARVKNISTKPTLSTLFLLVNNSNGQNDGATGYGPVTGAP